MADPASSVCPSCQGQNRLGATYCDTCGAPLAARCAGCERALRPGAKFCDECGRPVFVVASTSAVPAPPVEVTAQILDTRDALEGERKQVTVLFADIKGSMDLQADLDQEEWARIMGRFVDLLADGVHRFGGTVDKFTGDGIMALFGAPIAVEDHARRACHVALHLITEIGRYGAELRRSHGLSFHVRLGLNSGEVIVGRIGDDARMDYTAIGPAVGLAQRMEAIAKPDSAYLTAATAQLVAGFFQVRDLGPVPVKGVSEPVQVYLLEGIGPLRSGLDVARQRGLSRFVGRDRETNVLEEALEQALRGQAQVVGVVGEAGVGKSRICDEFARACQARGVNVLRARGVSHGTSVPYLPVLELLRNYFGITEIDTPRQAREKIAGRLVVTDPALESELPLFFDLLEVPDPDRPSPQLGEEARLRRIFAVVRRLARRRTERDEGLLVLLEDLHWLDKQSRLFFERYIESYPGTRTLVVANFRPEFHAPWMRHSYYRQVPLAPLDEAAVGEMITSLVGSDPSLDGFAGHIIGRTSGNPFFIEEVVRMLIDDGTLGGSPGSFRLVHPLERVRVPPTVQALVASRIDRLQPADKQVLQTASVIGITFSEDVLSRVVGRSEEDLADSLLTLCGAEFLINEAQHPVLEYRFWHPLTQEVAYGSMLGDRRAQIHATVAQALIDLGPGRLNERAALIANHFDAAGWPLDAARWSTRAADWALRTDINESLDRWRKAIELLDHAPASDEGLEIGLQSRHKLARWGVRVGMPQDEADRIVEEATAMAEAAGNTTALSLLAFSRGAASLYRGNVEQALASVHESVRLADTTTDLGLKTAARVAPPVVINVTGPLEEGLTMAEEALRWAEEDPTRGGEHLGYDLLARHLSTRAWLLARAGRLRDARLDADRTVGIARERGEAEILGWTLAVYPLIEYFTGEARDAVSLADEAVRVAEDTGNINLQPLVHAALGTAHLNRGEWTEAVRSCTLALDLAHRHSLWLFEEGSMNLFLAEAHLGAGDHDAALQAADEAVETSASRATPVFESGALVTRNRVRRLALDGEAVESADADLDRADRLIDETGAEAWRPFVHVERAELARLRGDEDRANEAQRDAIRAFDENGATGHAARLRTTWQIA